MAKPNYSIFSNGCLILTAQGAQNYLVHVALWWCVTQAFVWVQQLQTRWKAEPGKVTGLGHQKKISQGERNTQRPCHQVRGF